MYVRLCVEIITVGGVIVVYIVNLCCDELETDE